MEVVKNQDACTLGEVGPKSSESVLQETDEDMQSHREARKRTRQRLKGRGHQPRSTKGVRPHQQLGRPGMISPPDAPRGANPDDTLMLNFWSPKL